MMKSVVISSRMRIVSDRGSASSPKAYRKFLTGAKLVFSHVDGFFGGDGVGLTFGFEV